MWAITNLTAGGNLQQIVAVVQAGALKPLCDLLVVKETKIVTVILDAIMNILQVREYFASFSLSQCENAILFLCDEVLCNMGVVTRFEQAELPLLGPEMKSVKPGQKKNR